MQLRMTWTRMIVLVMGCALAVGSPAQGQCEVQEFRGSDIIAGDNFGHNVAIDGMTMVVGAPENATGAGAAYVYEFVGSIWVEVAKLTSSDLGSDDEFGARVAIRRNTILVAAPQHAGSPPTVGGPGAVYVFEKPSTGWTTMTETAKLTGSDSTGIDTFGSGLAIEGSTIVVGALNHNSNQGAVYIFKLTGDVWVNATETAKLTASDTISGDRLGVGVAIDRNVIVAGADQNGSLGPGAAYVYVRPAGGWAAMTETAKLTASDGAGSDVFGFAVDIHGNVIVVGAYLDDTTGGADAGSAYVFEKPVGGWITMMETQKVTASDGVAFDRLGRDVKIANDVMLFLGTASSSGIPGAVYRYTRTGGGWAETMQIVQSDGVGADRFGLGFDLSGDFLIVGAPEDDTGGTGSGSAYFFTDVTGINIVCSFPVPCPADIIGDDRLVNVTDLLALLAAWGVCP